MDTNEHVQSKADDATPGVILRRCREFHGFSLDDAAEATKVGKSYLEALENDNIKEFANLAYLKGFLRIYATYLGLNPDDLFHLYEKLYGSPEPVKNGASAATGVRATGKIRTPSAKLLLPLILLLLITVTAMIWNKREPQPVQQTSVSSVAQPLSAVSSAGRPVQSVMSSTHSRRSQLESPEPVQAPPALPAESGPEQLKGRPVESAGNHGSGFVVKMTVTSPGTLHATVDGVSSQDYTLEQGDVIEWKAEKKLFLDLSNGGGVQVELNGKPLAALGAPEEPAFVVIDHEGILH